MLFPPVAGELGGHGVGRACALRRSDAAKGAMNPIRVVVGPEIIQLPREVDHVPKERAIEVLASDGAD